jgi:hypothetical protein
MWGYTLKMIDTGLSDHKAQIQFQHKKKENFRLNEEYRIARSYREENIQYLNYLLGKENWELVLKQNSENEADTLRYYYDIAMPKNVYKQNGREINGLQQGKMYQEINSDSQYLNEPRKCQKNKKIYIVSIAKLSGKQKKLTNTMRMRASGNKVKTMWDRIKEEPGTQMKTPKNIEISKNGSIIQGPETIANVFMITMQVIPKRYWKTIHYQ